MQIYNLNNNTIATTTTTMSNYANEHHGSFPDILVTSTPTTKVMTRSAIYTSLDQPPIDHPKMHPPLPNCRCSQTMLAARRGISPEQLRKFQASDPTNFGGEVCHPILNGDVSIQRSYPTSILKRTDSRRLAAGYGSRRGSTTLHVPSGSVDHESAPLAGSGTNPARHPAQPQHSSRRFNMAALSIAGLCFLLFVIVSLVMMYTVIDDVLKKKMGDPFKKRKILKKPCEVLQCPIGGTCRENVNGIAECICLQCSAVTMELFSGPECGSDGQTYASECHRRLASCEGNKDILKKHNGPCSW